MRQDKYPQTVLAGGFQGWRPEQVADPIQDRIDAMKAASRAAADAQDVQDFAREARAAYAGDEAGEQDAVPPAVEMTAAIAAGRGE